MVASREWGDGLAAVLSGEEARKRNAAAQGGKRSRGELLDVLRNQEGARVSWSSCWQPAA
jgi:hypothetical protein